MPASQEGGWTAGPWPIAYTGDGKRIIIGEGLVEGPNGYDVAEVYADDCPQEVAEANARLIAAAPALVEALTNLERAATEVSRLGAQTGRQWVTLSGALITARAALALGKASAR